MKYEKSNKYVKIGKFSETIKKIRLTNNQNKLLDDLVFEIAEANVIFKKNIDVDQRIFLMPLLLLEGESSSLIEGIRSMYEDFAHDLEEINNIPQWETRNLINLYEKYLLHDYYSNQIEFSTSTIKTMHLDLFKFDPNSKFKMVFDTSSRINHVKPGRILKDDNKPNFIGNNNDIKEANLILLKPSLKEKYINDLSKTIETLVEKKELLWKHIIISHPIFEAIHPFVDGNGRLGRLILSILFKIKYESIKLPIYISEIFNENREIYKAKLLNVQLKNDYDAWNDWISYFIDCLIKTKRKLIYRITEIQKLWSKFENSKAMSTDIRKNLTALFFKYYKLNKNITIKKMTQKYPKVSLQTIYKDFDIVTKELDVKKESGSYFAFKGILKIIRAKI